MRVHWLALGIGCLAPGASAQPASRPVVVELFTSEGCSSCPPADAIVADLAHSRPDLLPLTFHVTYWNSLGWQDPFSFQAATDRQRRYVAASVSPNAYTPVMVVDGWLDVVGSDRAAVEATLARGSRGNDGRPGRRRPGWRHAGDHHRRGHGRGPRPAARL